MNPQTEGVELPPCPPAPRDGTIFYVLHRFPMRWTAYKPSSEQARRGVKGRWQRMNEYGGWENTDIEPTEWEPDLQNSTRTTPPVADGVERANEELGYLEYDLLGLAGRKVSKKQALGLLESITAIRTALASLPPVLTPSPSDVERAMDIFCAKGNELAGTNVSWRDDLPEETLDQVRQCFAAVLSAPPSPPAQIKVTEDMLNAGQERLCEIRSITDFDDDAQAEVFIAMFRAMRAPPAQIEAAPVLRDDAVERAREAATAVLRKCGAPEMAVAAFADHVAKAVVAALTASPDQGRRDGEGVEP